MRTREHAESAFVNLSDLSEIELLILKRMREFTIGDHRSVFHGTGFDFVGLRDWQPGDRLASIDWPQSTITNFSPLIVREFDQPSTAGVMVVADGSASTRCGIDQTPIAAAIARAIGIIGLSAVFFQDTFGLIRFDGGFETLGAVRPRIGKGQVIHCLDAYQYGHGLQEVRAADSLSARIAGYIRKPSLIPVISDFLFENARDIFSELTRLNSTHDVIIVLIDSAFAYELPPVSSGWVETFDVETGRARLVSRRTLGTMAARAREWQDDVQRMARAVDLDVLRLGLDDLGNAVTLGEFVAERRLRKAQ